jgi:hypothetical protein
MTRTHRNGSPLRQQERAEEHRLAGRAKTTKGIV